MQRSARFVPARGRWWCRRARLVRRETICSRWSRWLRERRLLDSPRPPQISQLKQKYTLKVFSHVLVSLVLHASRTNCLLPNETQRYPKGNRTGFRFAEPHHTLVFHPGILQLFSIHNGVFNLQRQAPGTLSFDLEEATSSPPQGVSFLTYVVV